MPRLENMPFGEIVFVGKPNFLSFQGRDWWTETAIPRHPKKVHVVVPPSKSQTNSYKTEYGVNLTKLGNLWGEQT